MDHDQTDQHDSAADPLRADEARRHNAALSRRTFLRALVAVGGTAVLAACGGA